MRSYLCWSVISLTLIIKLISGISLFNNPRSSFNIKLDEWENVEHVKEKFHPIESIKPRIHNQITRLSRAPLTDTHVVIFAVKHKNLEELESILWDVSDPESPNYGKHLTKQEVDGLVTNPKSAQHIKTYLENFEITVLNTSSVEFIHAEATIGQWEQILDTNFHIFQLPGLKNKKITRCLEYKLSEFIVNHVSSVFNTVQFPDLRERPRIRSHISRSNGLNKTININSLSSQSFNGFVTPTKLSDFYDIDSTLENAHAGQGVYEAIDQTFSPTDLTYFQQEFNLPIRSVVHDVGGHESNNACKPNNGNDCVEANLDVQYLMGVSPLNPTTYYYWDNDDFMLSWVFNVAAMDWPPLVFSISYGLDESEISTGYAQAFDVQAMKLGVRGVTITVSSGDDGAQSDYARDDSLSCGYNPSFPATSLYVVAVGGTMGPEKGSTTEIGCQSDLGGSITSGGGYSMLYSVPEWQKSQVQGYLAKVAGTSHDPPVGYNKNGRGIPDVSLLAHNYATALDQQFYGVSGTSASSPVFAGMISLINAARKNAGLSPLGWITPSLYKFSSDFTNDVTAGDNFCAASAGVCCHQGYYAEEGWDPVTGLGSINFALFKQKMMSLPNHPNSPSSPPVPSPNHPTFSPTEPPPTHAPTMPPTMDNGWMTVTDYSEVNCGGEVTTMLGVPTGVCFIEYDQHNQPMGSTMYLCAADKAYMTSYSDTRCRHGNEISKNLFYYGCAWSVSDPYAPRGPKISTELLCSSGEQGEPPLPTYDGSYVLHISYDSLNGCQEDLISGYEAYKQDHCYPADDQSDIIHYPYMYSYSGTTCQGQPKTAYLSSTCESTSQYTTRTRTRSDGLQGFDELQSAGEYEGYDNGNDELHERWVLGDTPPRSKAPTETPVVPPTAAPLVETSNKPTNIPAFSPTVVPSNVKGGGTSLTPNPTVVPSKMSTNIPTIVPSVEITVKPSLVGSVGLDNNPTFLPTEKPFTQITLIPTSEKNLKPTLLGSVGSTINPTLSPSLKPTWETTNKPVVSTFQPSFTPSRKPTVKPTGVTRKPSIAPTIPFSGKISLSILVDQILDDISAEEFLSDPANTMSFKEGVANSISKINSEDVSIISVTNIQSTKTQEKSETGEKACTVSYKIILIIQESGFKSAEQAYIMISYELQGAQISGTFNEQLHTAAGAHNAAIMERVNSRSVIINTTYSVEPVVVTTENGDENKNTDSGIIGAIIAIVVLVLILFSVWVFYKRNKIRVLLGYPSREGLYTMTHTHGILNNQARDDREEAKIDNRKSVLNILTRVRGGRQRLAMTDPEYSGLDDDVVEIELSNRGIPSGGDNKGLFKGSGKNENLINEVENPMFVVEEDEEEEEGFEV